MSRAAATRLAILVFFLGGMSRDSGYAFSNVKPGDTLENVELKALEGSPKPYLQKDKVNVFLFFTAGQKFSTNTLANFGLAEKELEGKPIYWVAIVSDRSPLEAIKAEVEGAKTSATILIDVDDELYGKLGVALTPVIGIADKDFKLMAYLPFTKIGYSDQLKAWVRRVNGEITEEELQAVLQPERAQEGGEEQKARRFLKLGERMLKAEDFDKALANADKALGHDAKSAPAHALKGAALAGKGNCKDALGSFEAALAIDPAEPTAVSGKAACSSKAP